MTIALPYRAASLRLRLRLLTFLCVAASVALTVFVAGFERDRAVKWAVAGTFGPHIVEVLEQVDTGTARQGKVQGLNWQLVPQEVLSLSHHRKWTETVFRFNNAQGTETMVRVAMAKSALDAAASFPGDRLDEQLSGLSQRIVALGSDATMRLRSDRGIWVEFTSPDYWHDRPTRTHLALVILGGGGGVLCVCWVATAALSAQLAQLSAYARDILRTRSVAPFQNRAAPEIAHLAEALNDINAELDQQVQERTRFLAAISHDLRTPATRMKLRAELIEDENLRGKVLADIQEISDMVTASLGFLRDGMDNSKWEKTLFPSLLQSMCDDYSDIGRPVTLDLPEPLVTKVSGTVFDPREKSISVNLDRHITLVCQPARLRCAFANLIDNALAYGDWARVAIEADADEILVRIIDGGPGIPQEQQRLVFDPFYRIEGSASHNTKGVGLGLSVAKSIITAHNGTIGFYDHHTHGLEVRVILPRNT